MQNPKRKKTTQTWNLSFKSFKPVRITIFPKNSLFWNPLIQKCNHHEPFWLESSGDFQQIRQFHLLNYQPNWHPNNRYHPKISWIRLRIQRHKTGQFLHRLPKFTPVKTSWFRAFNTLHLRYREQGPHQTFQTPAMQR